MVASVASYGAEPKISKCRARHCPAGERSEAEKPYQRGVSKPHRKFRFSEPTNHALVCSHSRAGVAPGGLPKAEATGLAPKQSAGAFP